MILLESDRKRCSHESFPGILEEEIEEAKLFEWVGGRELEVFVMIQRKGRKKKAQWIGE